MPIPIWQRLLGLLVYVLPWSDAIPFGQHLFIQFPVLQWLTLPAMPLFILESGIPLNLGNLLVFFVLFLAVVRNPNVPYFIRFNTLQALLVDIIVVIISYAFIILPIGGGLMMRTLSSTVVVGVLAVVIFALIECSRGREPDLPGLSQAIRMQLY